MIRLTQTVQKGGCAAKISAEVLRHTLGSLNLKSDDANVLIDGRDFDDAGIYRVTDSLALVQTLDFFTPIVDTPYLFGEVAAANAISDVYAMGGLPKTALAILAFPLATLDPMLMREILDGANHKIQEAGASLLGGHSIDDDTVKFGLSVTGLVSPQSMWTNKGARAGDRLILTKALGTGTLMAGLKASRYTEQDLQEAIDSMRQLNDLPLLLSEEERKQIHSATDITGFGILGHALQMAKASQVTLRIAHAKLPILAHALDALGHKHFTKAHSTNRSYTEGETVYESPMDNLRQRLLFDPQTSGGLLLSVAADHAELLLKKITSRFKRAEIVGEVRPQSAHCLEITNDL